MRIKPANIFQENISQDETRDKDLDGDIKINLNTAEKEDGSESIKKTAENEEKVIDEFAPQEDSFDKEQKGINERERQLGFHFPDESTIVINPDNDDHDSIEEAV